MPDYTSGGDQGRLGNDYSFKHLTLTSNLMLSSKEKRRLRRTADKMEKRTTFESRGMDVMPFYAKTDSQTDLWSSLNKNTVTIAVGPAGVGKTLVALWFGLSAIKSRAFNKIIYVRSDVGCAHQRGRGALPGTMEEKDGTFDWSSDG